MKSLKYDLLEATLVCAFFARNRGEDYTDTNFVTDVSAAFLAVREETPEVLRHMVQAMREHVMHTYPEESGGVDPNSIN